jgi:hypothetical protein
VIYEIVTDIDIEKRLKVSRVTEPTRKKRLLIIATPKGSTESRADRIIGANRSFQGISRDFIGQEDDAGQKFVKKLDVRHDVGYKLRAFWCTCRRLPEAAMPADGWRAQ